MSLPPDFAHSDWSFLATLAAWQVGSHLALPPTACSIPKASQGHAAAANWVTVIQ